MSFADAYAHMMGTHPLSQARKAPAIFQYTETEMRKHAEGYVPDYMVEVVMAWIMDGRVPEGFLRAVLHNDLMQAVASADSQNRPKLNEWVVFLHNFTPTGCHGSKADCDEWFEIGGLNGMEERLKSQAAEANRNYEKRDKEQSIEIRERRDRADEHPQE